MNNKPSKQPVRRRVRRRNPTGVGAMVRADVIANPRPGPLDSTLVVCKKFRFQNGQNGYTQYNLTAAKLGALVTTCTVNSTQATQLFDTVQLLAVEVWSSETTLGIPATCTVTWSGNTSGNTGPQRNYTDTSIGSTRVAHVRATTNPSFQTGQWQSCDTTSPGSNLLFSIYCNVGAVVDVTCNYTVTGLVRTANNTVTLSGATAVLTGIYYLALDNNAGGNQSVGSTLIPADLRLPTTK